MSDDRVRPLADVTCIWDCDASHYPDRVRMTMADGKVVTYRIDIDMPHPQVMKTIDLIRQMRKNVNGYPGKHTKSDRGNGDPNGHREKDFR